MVFILKHMINVVLPYNNVMSGSLSTIHLTTSHLGFSGVTPCACIFIAQPFLSTNKITTLGPTGTSPRTLVMGISVAHRL
jgi:hypothetical protein